MKKTIIIICSIVLFNFPAYAYVKHLLVTAAPTTIEFHLIDPYGNITGYTSNGVLTQIPNVTYILESVPSPGEIGPYESYHAIHRDTPNLYQVTTGKYKLVVYGSNTPTIARIGVEARWSENPSWSDFNISKRLIYPNVTWIYEFEIPIQHIGTSIRGQLSFIKASNPADLIKDITIAGQLGYIGNPHFVSETIEKINEIEKEHTKPTEKDDDHKLTPAQKAKKEYTELLGEITEKYNKPESDEFVKQEAYTVLREDIEYIIGHL